MLACLDTLQAIFSIMCTVKELEGNFALFDFLKFDDYMEACFFLFITAFMCSLLWTTCIAFHVQVRDRWLTIAFQSVSLSVLVRG